MVTFRLIEEDEQRIVYWYFPEGKEDKGHGIIIVDKIQEEIDITEVAPDDFERDIPAEELKKYLDAVDSPEKFNALSAIILLYYYGNESQYATLKRQLVECLKDKFKSVTANHVHKSAEYTILLLDLICCPYLDYEDKRKIASQMGIDRNRLTSILKYLKKQEYMFTKWTKVDITKELSAKISQEVYS